MPKTTRLHVDGAESEVIEEIVRAGVAPSRGEAMRMVLDTRGRQTGFLDEAKLLLALRRAAAARPLSEQQLTDGIRRAKDASLPEV